MTAQALTSVEWVRLTSYWSTTSSGQALTAEQAADCDALAARIKIPRTLPPPKPGTMPPAVPIAQPPPDSSAIV